MAVAWSFSKDDAFGGKSISNGTDRYAFPQDLTDGTGANQANKMYVATRTLVASASEDLDLSGALTNQFGDTISFTAIKGIKITLLPTTAASSITIGAAASHAWVGFLGSATDTITIRNGYSFGLLGTDAAGMTVTNASSDILTVTNNDSGLSATYTIMLYGK